MAAARSERRAGAEAVLRGQRIERGGCGLHGGTARSLESDPTGPEPTRRALAEHADSAERDVRTRLHDLAHLITHARLELGLACADAAPLERLEAVRRTLEQCAPLVSGRSDHVEPGPCALAELIEREVRHARAARRGTGPVRVRVQVEPGLATHADAADLGRLVRNLALNALEASPDQSTVWVRAYAEGDGRRCLEVRDEGRGLTNEERARLFGNGLASRGGTGIGTRSIVDCARRLGAELEVLGAPGAGTTIRITWSDVAAPLAGVLADSPRLRRRLEARLRAEGLHVLADVQARALFEHVARGGRSRVVAWVVARGTRDVRFAELAHRAECDGFQVRLASVADPLSLDVRALQLSRPSPPCA